METEISPHSSQSLGSTRFNQTSVLEPIMMSDTGPVGLFEYLLLNNELVVFGSVISAGRP